MKYYPALNPPNKTTINKKNAGFKAGAPNKKTYGVETIKPPFQNGPPAFVNEKPTCAGCGVRPHHLGTGILRQSTEARRPGTAKRQAGLGGRPWVSRVGEFPMGKEGPKSE